MSSIDNTSDDEFVRNVDRTLARSAAERAAERWWHIWARGIVGAAVIWGLALAIYKLL